MFVEGGLEKNLNSPFMKTLYMSITLTFTSLPTHGSEIWTS
jgi:hypothetical protein